MITSTSNPRVKALAKLKQRRHREAEQRFPIEGARVVMRAAAARWPMREAVYAPELASAETRDARTALEEAGVPVTEFGEAAFRRIAYRQHPDGILAVGVARSLDIAALRLPAQPLVLVVDNVEKPGNLGAMVRTADGAGVDAVIAAGTGADPFNPNAVRASQGALFSMQLAVASAPATIAFLRDRAVTIHPAGPDGGATPWECDLTGPVAVVIGSEHAGVSDAWHGLPSLSIPMAGTSDSLNAAAAAAVVLFEAVRQRSGSSLSRRSPA